MDHTKPDIVRYKQAKSNGIQLFSSSRKAIGYVISGKKYIYSGDKCIVAQPGDIFFLDIGNHYIEHVPDAGETDCEQLIFYFTDDKLTKILSLLSFQFSINIPQSNRIRNENNTIDNFVVVKSWETIRIFLDSVPKLLQIEKPEQSDIGTMLILTYLVFQLMSSPDSLIFDHLVHMLNDQTDNICAIIQENIFNNLSINELAGLCGKSPSVFKRKFEAYYNSTPHQYMLHQRLIHARTLLMSTSLTVAEIGQKCALQNTSHFIKCFRKEYGFTPFEFRMHLQKGINGKLELRFEE